MFFVILLTRTLILQPKHLGPMLEKTINEQLVSQVESSWQSGVGYVILILNIEDIGDGKIRDGTGEAIFHVRFKALIMRPFKGEVCLGIVKEVTEVGIFVESGPLSVFISKDHSALGMVYDKERKVYTDKNESEVIRENSEVRFRIINYKEELNEVMVIGTFKDEYLGLVS